MALLKDSCPDTARRRAAKDIVGNVANLPGTTLSALCEQVFGTMCQWKRSRYLMRETV
ncbi:MAG: hypothetical protein ACYDCS_11430 [Candidatus Dormibacteria bacterium]